MRSFQQKKLTVKLFIYKKRREYTRNNSPEDSLNLAFFELIFFFLISFGNLALTVTTGTQPKL